MGVSESNRRIKFSYQLDNWSYENGARSYLKANGNKIIPSEYRAEMDGTLFCPACFTNLNRIPKEKDHFTNGREAYFAHMSKYIDIKCDLKSIKPEGKRYENWEEAKKAIDDENLVVISSFLQIKPEPKEGKPEVYDETPVEDIDGPTTEVAIGRYKGESFPLPTKIKTVTGLCRNFDENLYKYFHLPERSNAIRLMDLLKNVKLICEKNDKPRFYYGRIIRTSHLGEHKRPTNFRMTYLQTDVVGDFCLKSQDKDQKAHGITDDSIGRILIVYGSVQENGTGLCFQGLGWGEFGLLPEKYNHLLD